LKIKAPSNHLQNFQIPVGKVYNLFCHGVIGGLIALEGDFF